MKNLILALGLTTALTGVAGAQEITEFNVGVLGGENAQDRASSNECYRAKIEEALGVPVKMFTPADYDGVIQGLLGGTLDLAWLGASGYAKAYLTDPEAVEVALTKQNADGSTGYYSFAFARAAVSAGSQGGSPATDSSRISASAAEARKKALPLARSVSLGGRCRRSAAGTTASKPPSARCRANAYSMASSVRDASSGSRRITAAALSASRLLVASSSNSSGGFFSIARAMAMRWRCPPESRTPRSPKKVW